MSDWGMQLFDDDEKVFFDSDAVAGRTFTLEAKADTINTSRTPSNGSTAQITIPYQIFCNLKRVPRLYSGS